MAPQPTPGKPKSTPEKKPRATYDPFAIVRQQLADNPQYSPSGYSSVNFMAPGGNRSNKKGVIVGAPSQQQKMLNGPAGFRQFEESNPGNEYKQGLDEETTQSIVQQALQDAGIGSNPQPSSGSSSGSGSSGGGSSMLGAMLLKSLTSGSYKDPYNALNASLGGIYDTAKADIGSNYDTLKTYLTDNQVNPYENAEVRQTDVSPQMAGFLQSQNIDTAPLQAQVTADQGTRTDRTDAMKDMYAMLAKVQGASNQSAMNDVATGRTADMNSLNANRGAYSAQIENKSFGQRENIMKTLQTMALYGMLDPKKLKGL